MRHRINAVFICNLAGDDPCSPINSHISGQHTEAAAKGIAYLSQAGNCSEIIVCGDGTDTSALIRAISEQTGTPVIQAPIQSSPVLRDETALYSVLETGKIRTARAELDYLREFPSYGYKGRPTLVIDAETAYQAGRVVSMQAAAVTKHIAIIDGNTVIDEVDVGRPISAVLADGDTNKPALVGGLLGSVLDSLGLEKTLVGFRYEFDSIRVINSGDCIINMLADIYRSIEELSCAKCVLCREGSRQLRALFADAVSGRGRREDVALVEDVCPLIRAGALCDFGRNMVKPAMTAAIHCRDRLEMHIIHRRCPEAQCAGLLSFVIDPSLCIGCRECVDECPEEAIEGKDGFIHVIDEKMCTKCGKCVEFCDTDAIKLNNGSIRTPKKPVRVGRFN